MKPTILRLALLFSITSLFQGLVQSQSSYGSVNGTVRDATGATVPGAQVTLTNTETGVKVVRNTNESGFFVFVNVVPGNYALGVQAKGFSTAHESAFALRVNDTQTH